MISNNIIDSIINQFNNSIKVRQAAPDIWQLIAPFYHADGDMIEIYIQPSQRGPNYVTLTDWGMTMMRLSYANDIESDSVQRYVQSILAEQNLDFSEGVISVEMPVDSALTFIPYYAQGLSKVMAINAISRDISRSLFYDSVKEFILATFSQYNPVQNYVPDKGNAYFSVDYMLRRGDDIPVNLFPVKDTLKGERVVGTMLFMKSERIPGRNIIIPESLDEIAKETQKKLIDFSYKPFYDEDGFRKEGPAYITELLRPAS